MGKIREQVVWFASDKLVAVMPAGLDHNGLRPDRPGTLNIEPPVANDPDVARVQRPADVGLGFRQGPAGDLVPVREVVGEPPEWEVVPQPVMPQLDLRPGPDVPGQKSDGRAAPLAAQGILDARQDS